jgi:hypothetical protein
MFFRVRDQFQRTRFNLLCHDILRTPPLRMRDADVTFVSQVSHRDVLMYLIAIKSVYRFFDAGRIVVLDDGSLTNKDRVLLTYHLPSIRVVTFGQVPIANTPRGGCWERLLLISSLVRHSYVIQVDSDSLTLHEIPEVLHCVGQNWNFTLLGAGSFPAVESMRDACSRATRNGQSNTEPQGVSERSLDRFPDCYRLTYVRGSAAFSGFARNSFGSPDVEYFSKNMEAICGPDKWHEWGSEQVASNLVVANSAKVYVLQHPKYTSYFALPGVDYSRSSFVHFIGIHRFRKGCYSKLARQTIRGLTSAARNRAGFDPYALGRPDPDLGK